MTPEPWVIDRMREERERSERPHLRLPVTRESLEPSEEEPVAEASDTRRGVHVMDISPESPNVISI